MMALAACWVAAGRGLPCWSLSAICKLVGVQSTVSWVHPEAILVKTPFLKLSACDDFLGWRASCRAD